MEAKYEVFDQIAWKIDYNVVDFDNLMKDILKDPQNKMKVLNSIKNELNDISSNVKWLNREQLDQYADKLNKSFDKYTKNEKISSDKLIDDISKISSPKAQEIVQKHETKKLTKPIVQAKQEESWWMEKFAWWLIWWTLKRNQQTYAMLDEQ